ncbi:MAG: hypothetical protein K1X92_03975 [Bacteroidia bacterium]|nr:hypothetical protein [Bacteroidia bacterium]
MKILISFDDTGSMSSLRKVVREKCTEFVNHLFDRFKGLQIGVIIHNDYCDADTIQQLDFTYDRKQITEFINRNSSMGGGDSDECYEYVLQLATEMNWDDTDKKILIMIGDCNPHPVGYKHNGKTYNIDWKQESQKLADLGVQIYAIQAMGNRSSSKFYEGMSKITGGVKLDLTQFKNIPQYLTAITYQQEGKLEEYENSDESFKKDYMLRNMFSKLKRGAVSMEEIDEDKIEMLSRFQVMNVEYDCQINDFVREHGRSFKAGSGYYQLAGSEKVQPHKKIVFVHRETGEMTDNADFCRGKLGILGEPGTVTVSPKKCKDALAEYDVFIQSTSYNRKLDAGTKFLYELERS